MNNEAFHRYVERVGHGERLGSEDAACAFGAIMEGGIDDTQIAAFIAVLAKRTPAVDEIVGAVRAMRARMIQVEGVEGAIDLCGTGGDGLNTLNISTTCAFVVAGAGVPVAKHGNRSMSSKCGAADVIEALGAKVDLDAAASARCLKRSHVCFLFAQTYHPAMKHAAPARRALGFRTIFNLLGPLANPAGVSRQLVGVYASDVLETIAEALHRLGTERAWVVHGEDGLDELTVAAATNVAVLENGKIHRMRITPEDVGLARAKPSDIEGGTAETNALAIRRLFEGERGPFRDIVLLNSAAALCVASKVPSVEHGIALAATSIDSGQARATLESFVAQSNA